MQMQSVVPLSQSLFYKHASMHVQVLVLSPSHRQPGAVQDTDIHKCICCTPENFTHAQVQLAFYFCCKTCLPHLEQHSLSTRMR